MPQTVYQCRTCHKAFADVKPAEYCELVCYAKEEILAAAKEFETATGGSYNLTCAAEKLVLQSTRFLEAKEAFNWGEQ